MQHHPLNPTTINGGEEGADVFKAIARDRILRQQLGRQSHQMFFTIYLPHYIRYQMAEFHKDIIRITEDESHNLACIVAFRGSGKSTLVTFSYALWSILGVQQKKFVLIICQTQAQARQHMANLKYELESNQLLKSDLGPFREDAGSGEWAISSLVFRNTGARIMIASIDQSVRGMRHRQHRPDLIVLDDIEDSHSVRTFEGRNKIADWFAREVVPLGDIGTRIIVIGNLLHEDGLMARLTRKIDDDDIKGVHRWFPLLDEHGKCLWPGKFDTLEKIEELRKSVGNDVAWIQEYLLRIVSDATRPIAPEWIHYYDEPLERLIPAEDRRRIFAAADLAISLKDSADCTSIVRAVATGYGDTIRVYILPNPVNTRVQMPEAVRLMKHIIATSGERGKLILETNQFQEGYQQLLLEDGYNKHKVEGVKVTEDKRTRLMLTSTLVQNGNVQFPRKGCEELIAQITNFGYERYDDLADAFSTLILHLMTMKPPVLPSVTFIGGRKAGRRMCGGFWDDDD